MVLELPAVAKGWRNRVMRFTIPWFSVTMGTGVVNTLLFNLPYSQSHVSLRAAGSAFLILDIVLFLSFMALTITRYAIHPQFFSLMLSNESHSLFLGTIPMSLVTIASGIARTGTEYGLSWTLNCGLYLWWIAGAMSVMTSFGVPYLIFTRHVHTPSSVSATLLLPIVPPITISAVSSSFATLLIANGQADYAFVVMLVGYVMLGIGLGLALGVLVIYAYKLILEKLPPGAIITSTFLPLGPVGQGGFALIELGRVSLTLFPLLEAQHPERPHVKDLANIAIVLYGTGILAGLGLWALGIWYTFIAIASMGSIGKSLRFNMGFWGLVFPLASLTLLTSSLATTFDSKFFEAVTAIFTASVILLWALVALPTAIGFIKGTLFAAPCLASLPEDFFTRLSSDAGDEKAREIVELDDADDEVGAEAKAEELKATME